MIAQAARIDTVNFGCDIFQRTLESLSPNIPVAQRSLRSAWAGLFSNHGYESEESRLASKTLPLLANLLEQLALEVPFQANLALQCLIHSETEPPAEAMLRHLDLSKPLLSELFYSYMLRSLERAHGAGSRIARRSLAQRACRSSQMLLEVLLKLRKCSEEAQAAVSKTILFTLLRSGWSGAPSSSHPLLREMAEVAVKVGGDRSAFQVADQAQQLAQFSLLIERCLHNETCLELIDALVSDATVLVTDNWMLPAALRQSLVDAPTESVRPLGKLIREAWARTKPYDHAKPSPIVCALFLSEWRAALLGNEFRPTSLAIALSRADRRSEIKSGFAALMEGIMEIRIELVQAYPRHAGLRQHFDLKRQLILDTRNLLHI